MKTSLFNRWILLLLLLMPCIAWAENPASVLPEQKNPDKNVPQVLVFVSFSMPIASLAAIVHDAQQQGAQVLLRGLVDRSFKRTVVRLSEVIKQAGGGGMQLDPVAFERYHITCVPTVVVLNTPDNFDTLAGDMPLAAALTAIHNHRAASSVFHPEL